MDDYVSECYQEIEVYSNRFVEIYLYKTSGKPEHFLVDVYLKDPEKEHKKLVEAMTYCTESAARRFLNENKKFKKEVYKD